MCIYIYIYTYISLYIYIYIERERDMSPRRMERRKPGLYELNGREIKAIPRPPPIPHTSYYTII